MTEYYIIDNNGNQVGPISEVLFNNYGVTASTLVWCEGMPEWKHASHAARYAAPVPGAAAKRQRMDTTAPDKQLAAATTVGPTAAAMGTAAIRATMPPDLPCMGNRGHTVVLHTFRCRGCPPGKDLDYRCRSVEPGNIRLIFRPDFFCRDLLSLTIFAGR